jgi:ribonucleoside-diphosphate reductase alpha chain
MNVRKSDGSYEEAFSKALDYFNGDDLAANVFLSKYALRNDDGTFIELTPDDMHRRLAKEFARIEKKFGGEKHLSEEEIYNLFKNFKYIIPGGSVMSSLGNNNVHASLSNCFVIGQPEDSYGSIMTYRDYQVELMKRRGGVGVDLSKLRPSDSKVNNAALKSTGPVSFMEVNSEITKEVAQGGRRGALMISINGNHPDVEEFILKKQDLTKCTGANISVQFTDEFMDAVINNKDFILRWPVDCNIKDVNIEELPLNEKVWMEDKRCLKRVHSNDIWKQFIHCSWNTAEPGIMYLNKHWDLSPDGVYEQYKGVTTNPCGEIFMGAGDSCRLMHINLSSFVNNPYKYKETIEEHNDGKVITSIKHNIPEFDFKKLEEVAYKNMRLCDDLVELELEHVEDIIKHIESTYIEDNRNELELWKRIYETGRSSRRAGCGATGLGDAIAMLGYKMNEQEGFELEEKIFKTKMLGELKAQFELAKERGTFVGYDFSKEWDVDKIGSNKFFNNLQNNFNDIEDWSSIKEGIEKYGRRNVSWSTMAPVGTGAIMCQGTSGVEPLFSPFYKRRKKVMTSKDKVDFIDANGEKFSEFFVVHKPFKDWIIKNGIYSNFDYDINKTFDEQVTEDKLNKWFKESPWYGSTAPELTPSEHIKSQSIVQKYTTHSISKTINLPNSATEEEISKLFIDGWKQNLKGLTIYRDGCRDGVLITSNDSKKCKCADSLTHSAPKRPKTLPCDIKRFRNGGEEWIACIGLYDGMPYEIFTGKSEKLNLPKYVDTAEIVKNKINKEVFNKETEKYETVKVSRYDIKYVNSKQETCVIEGLNAVFNPEFYNYSKLISAILRHGMPIEYVISTIKSLDFKNDTINTWKNGVIRSLKTYLKDGETGELCPECGGKLVRINGCISCPNCGWSKCG